MGAAFDLMCENEGLEARITSKNRQIREQKKLIAELAEGILKYAGVEVSESQDCVNVANLQSIAKKVLAKQNKKKKK